MNPESAERLRVAVDNFKAAIIRVAEWLNKVLPKIWKDFKEFFAKRHRIVGYKRRAKAKQIAYYKTISAGKSNNWRKTHGLPLARSRC